jgi:AraC family transcriptional regulator
MADFQTHQLAVDRSCPGISAVSVSNQSKLNSPANANRYSSIHNAHRSDGQFVIAQTSPDRVDSIKSLPVALAPNNNILLTEISRTTPGHGEAQPLQKADAYSVCVHLSDLDEFSLWRDEERVDSTPIVAGTIHIDDMRHEWRADIRSAFHVMNLYIPQTALNMVTDDQGLPRIESFDCSVDSRRIDTVFHSLALSFLPTLVRQERVNRLFIDYATRAAIVHVATTFGSLHLPNQFGGGGLAPWQERRAKELLIANLAGDLSLSELAATCRLSTSHFIQAFRQTVGCPPHQWLLTQRIERAKQLILNSKQPLSQIALSTGFADQSHFTRVFTQRINASPAAWRRAQAR